MKKSQWQGKVVWAFALSRPWLPDDGYAWELLRQSLRWFCGKTEFAPPEVTLFTARFEDTSARARAYREKGLAVPSFYGRENKTPDDIRELLEKLKALAYGAIGWVFTGTRGRILGGPGDPIFSPSDSPATGNTPKN